MAGLACEIQVLTAVLMKIQAIWDVRLNKFGDDSYRRFVRIVSFICRIVQRKLKSGHQIPLKLRNCIQFAGRYAPEGFNLQNLRFSRNSWWYFIIISCE
jgi:hypothetical protein